MNFRYRGPLATMPADVRAALLERSGGDVEKAADAVRALRDEVRTRGDAALRDLTKRFDGATVDTLEVARGEWRAALSGLPREVATALRVAHDNIRRFHEAQRREALQVEVAPGVTAGRRYLPLARAGVYVPGGRAAYPSTVLMAVTPAKAAGVPEVVVCTPPGPDGSVNPLVLAACELAGADRVFRVGGAQAIFAMAYGTASVPRVQRIVGPGNVYVTAAKALVAGHVGIDSPAGPSEILILADETADPRAVAWDLLAQAEHDPQAASVLVTWSRALAEEVERLLPTLVAETPRRDIVRVSLAGRGALLLAATAEEAVAFSEAYAPEHLSVQARDAEALLERLSTYGSAFLGPWSAVAFGDYCAGPNHVLPTAGLAAAFSGLSVDDFLRRPTHLHVTAEGAHRLAPAAQTLATAEGLPAHAASVAARLAPREAPR
ncbi:MAG TPA: histidinol dehydrogenase [Candidatus Thermoplasmatota archaeon]|nr:histidinol dehydrogenase [Candidatus Thermoplasmatota archaeon]